MIMILQKSINTVNNFYLECVNESLYKLYCTTVMLLQKSFSVIAETLNLEVMSREEKQQEQYDILFLYSSLILYIGNRSWKKTSANPLHWHHLWENIRCIMHQFSVHLITSYIRFATLFSQIANWEGSYVYQSSTN